MLRSYHNLQEVCDSFCHNSRPAERC